MGGHASIDARLTDLKSINFLRDAWRLKHPRDRQFTWFNSDLSLASRLDSFLISRYLCAQVISCEIRPCVYSDHDFVYIELNRLPLAVQEFGNLITLYCKMTSFAVQFRNQLITFYAFDRPFRRI